MPDNYHQNYGYTIKVLSLSIVILLVIPERRFLAIYTTSLNKSQKLKTLNEHKMMIK